MIYFITARDIGRVKIGYSANPFARFSKIQSDNPSPLALERICDGDEADEAAVHSRFGCDRIRGEWFILSEAIEAHMATLDEPQRPRREQSIAQTIVAATGCSNSYAQQMLSDKYPHAITIPIAVSVYRYSGDLIGPLEGATDHEIDILEKYCGRFSK